MPLPIELQYLVPDLRTRIDDLNISDYEYTDEELHSHLKNNFKKYEYSTPLSNSDEQLLIVESMMTIVTALKMWADGESYSYKNDAVQMTRGLMSKHYLDTIRILREEKNEILEGNGGVY